MNTQGSNADQLCFSVGRPLAILVEEIECASQNPKLKKAAGQMREALQTFEAANRSSSSLPAQAREALYELLTK